MARQKFYHDPSRKHIETFQNFSGGLNTVSSNVNVADHELTELKNVDLGERGSLKRRKGFDVLEYPEIENGIQGIFRYVRRHTPYNLIGIDGEFSGLVKEVGSKAKKIGSWVVYSNKQENYFKATDDSSLNIINNSDFELGITGWQTTYEGSEIIDTSYAYSGTKVLKVNKETVETQKWKNEYQDHTVTVKPGEKYYMESMFRTAPGKSKPDRNHNIMRVYYSDGRNPTNLYTQRSDVESTWKKNAGVFTVPEGASHVRFGVGMFHDTGSSGAYFDDVIVKKANGDGETVNTCLGIRSVADDTSRSRGMNIKMSGFKPSTYYLFAVRYKSDGVGEGRLVTRDERFGIFPQDNHLLFAKDIPSKSTEWQTVYMTFKSYDAMTDGRAYVYNYSPLGVASTVYYDKARVYELTADEYNKIDKDPEYTGGVAIDEKFPFRNNKLKNEVLTENVVVANGMFYSDGSPIEVEGGLSIQSDRSMEAVMYGNYLYIASGSGLLVYNGSAISKVTPYEPSPMEQLYIGTNALKENPYEVVDTEDTVVNVNNIRFSSRYGIVNEFITVTVGVSKPNGLSLEYKFERRNRADKKDNWFTISDWSYDNEATFITDVSGEYQFKISVRESGKILVLDEYNIPKYIVKGSEDERDTEIDANTINMCNRILVHWDRILLYGDQAKDDVLYISDLYNPSYFPTNNTLQFLNPRKEQITSIVRFRDNLVVFTPSSIQAMYGKSPEDYRRIMINPNIGCISEKGAKVVKNHILFPSLDGIALMKSVGVSETKSNVDFIDGKIKNLVEQTEDSIAYVRDNQYCIVYPSSNKQLRYYYEWGVWVLDESPIFNLRDVIVEDNNIMAISHDGNLIVDGTGYSDNGFVYDMFISTKYFYFREPYAVKKTKEIQVMFNELVEDTTINVQAELDTGDLAYSGNVSLNTDEDVYKLMSPGKTLSIKFNMLHKEDKPLNLTGVAFIFKLKNP